MLLTRATVAKNGGRGTVLFLILAAAAIFIPDWESATDKITAYSALCESVTVNGRCNKISYTLSPTTYTVYAREQTVISQIHGTEPTRLAHCAVVDRKNWRCRYSDDSGEMGFTDGQYFNRVLGPNSSAYNKLESKTVRLSRLEYMKYKYLDSK